MPKLRYLLATGVSVAIALNDGRTWASPEVPPLAQPQLRPLEGDPLQLDLDIPSPDAIETESRQLAQPVGQATPDAVDPIPGDAIEPPEDAEGIPPLDLEDRPEDPPPDYLNPSPNPLQFPTQPEEVEIVGTQPITLEQALELARQNNRELQQAQLDLQQAQQSLREARADYLPDLSLQSNLTRTDSASSELSIERQEELGIRDFQRDLQPDTTTTTLDATLELTYDIFTSGRRDGQVRTAKRQVRFSELELERIAEQIRLDVTNAYYDLQEANEQVRIARAAVDNAQQSLKDAQALERAGVGTRFDVLRSQVQLADEEQVLTQRLGDLRIARRQLAQLLSVAQTVNLGAADPVEIAGFWDLTLEESIIRAFKHRAELEQQLVQREISEQQRRVALSAVRPQVSAFANYNVLNQSDDDLGFADGNTIGLQFRWNFYDGGAARARADQQETNIELAETRFAQLRDQVRFQVEQAYSDLQTNLENIQTTTVALAQARESLRLARLRFQAGVGTQTDVIQAETDLTSAEGNRLQAIIGYNRALATLQRVVSNLPPAETFDLSGR